MTHDPNTSHADRARTAIRSVLAGAAPNGTRPEDCGPYADAVAGVFAGYAAKGTEGARTVWTSQTKADPRLVKLVSTEPTEAERTWGGVLPFHKADLPDFPLDIYPTWLREYCEAVTETMQTPPDLAGMLALAIISTACAQRVQVQARQGWVEPVNIYTVVSLPPGSRKSPVFRAMMGPIHLFEKNLLEKVQGDIETAEIRRDILKQQLEESKRKASKAQGEHATRAAFSDVDGIAGEIKDLVIPKVPKLIVDDVTPEPLASILADHGRIAVLSAEGDIFAIMAGRYSSGAPNIGVYKRGHAGEHIRVERRNRSEHVDNACITMGVTTQPEVLRGFGQNATFRSEGLLARFFYALPKDTVGARATEPPPIPSEARSRYYRHVLELLESLYSGNSGNSGNRDNNGNSGKDLYIDDSTNTTTIEISIEASNRFNAFAAWLEPQLSEYGTFHTIRDWASKLAGAVLRIAGLLHMADQVSHNSQYSQNAISDNTLARAIRLAHYLIPHAQAAYAEIGADPAVESAKLVLRWIDKSGARAFTKRDCYQGVKGTLKRAADLDPVLELLADHGYLREVPALEREGPGRKPSPTYEVNPLVFDGSHNSQYSQNAREAGASYAPLETAAYQPPTFRSVEGY